MRPNMRFLIILLFITATTAATAETTTAKTTGDGVSWGTHFLAGGRYDDVRMCVGSPAGVKGGPIMDIYLDIRFPAGENALLAVSIPVMRPILFGVAFDMLQFEPQVTFEYHFGKGKSPYFVLGGGLGAIFHYGPDYNSDKDSRGPSFFAAGPLFSISAGLGIEAGRSNWMPGLKIFYAPLFSSERPTGTVFGGAIELHYWYR